MPDFLAVTVDENNWPDPWETPTCFIAMAITTSETDAERYRDKNHWVHVREHLFVPAIEAAGFQPVRPVSKGSSMIHADIVQNLEKSDMVLCDLSALNPNVFFELGVRVSLDKPIALVRDEKTTIPFDLGGVNAHSYDSEGLQAWKLQKEVEALTAHLQDATVTCDGSNPLWRQFGLTMRAQESDPDESPLEAQVALLNEQVAQLRSQVHETPANLLDFLAEVEDERRNRTSPGDEWDFHKPTGNRAAELVMTRLAKWGLFLIPTVDPERPNIVQVRLPHLDTLAPTQLSVLRQTAKDEGAKLEVTYEERDMEPETGDN